MFANRSAKIVKSTYFTVLLCAGIVRICTTCCCNKNIHLVNQRLTRVMLQLCFLEFRGRNAKFLDETSVEVGTFHAAVVGNSLYRILRIALHKLNGVVEAEAVDVGGKGAVGIRLDDG